MKELDEAREALIAAQDERIKSLEAQIVMMNDLIALQKRLIDTQEESITQRQGFPWPHNWTSPGHN